MKKELNERIDRAESRVNNVEIRQAEHTAQIGGVREMLAEVRSDIKTLIARSAA